MANPKNRGLPAGIAETVHSSPGERTRKTYATVEDPEPTQAPAAPAKKVGRPKGPDKVKKTLYFTQAGNFEKAQKGLVKYGDTLIKDESELADLALAVLASMVNDLEKVKTIIGIYEAEIKPNS